MSHEIQDIVRGVISLEMATLQDLLQSVDDSFSHAVHMILESTGKVVFCGIGKSGHIAHKIAATFSSVGTPAIFLHPSEALHGDLGIVEEGNIVVLISKSGESDELIGILPSLKKIKCNIITITANRESTLAQHSALALYTPIEKEACALNLAPTCSVISALAVGDALAVSLMKLKNFSKEDFALYHPAGRLGKRLLLLVDDLMKAGDEHPVISQEDSFEKVLTALAKGGTNGLSVVDEDGVFLGLITSFDIRKAISSEEDFKKLKAKNMMFTSPVTIQQGTSATKAYNMMRSNPKPLLVIPVLEGNKAKGILTLQDMVRAGL